MFALFLKSLSVSLATCLTIYVALEVYLVPHPSLHRSRCEWPRTRPLNEARALRQRVFYKLATREARANDVTLVLETNLMQLDGTLRVIEAWRGPVALAVVVVDELDELPAIEAAWRRSLALRQRVDVHLLYARNTRYPRAALLNLAARHVKTQWLLVAADGLLIGEQTRAALVRRFAHAAANETAFVVPTFDSLLPLGALPRDKRALVAALRLGTVERLLATECLQCTAPCDYARWMSSEREYAVPYSWLFQPLAVVHKQEFVEFDEQLRGDANVYTLRTLKMAMRRNFRFVVLADAFAIRSQALLPRPLQEDAEVLSEVIGEQCEQLEELTQWSGAFESPNSRSACKNFDAWLGTVPQVWIDGMEAEAKRKKRQKRGQ